MKPKDIFEAQSKFISPKHIAHSAHIYLETLNLQEDVKQTFQSYLRISRQIYNNHIFR
ncbi:hypothetical protein [Helicobacter typhlonius]|uniref:hypothetical protein n=1 Tax=Helicobacter typhlonius TaxID=76936 RepID=UPI002FE06E3A